MVAQDMLERGLSAHKPVHMCDGKPTQRGRLKQWPAKELFDLVNWTLGQFGGEPSAYNDGEQEKTL
jgi:hypothetical protein